MQMLRYIVAYVYKSQGFIAIWEREHSNPLKVGARSDTRIDDEVFWRSCEREYCGEALTKPPCVLCRQASEPRVGVG